jgi:predicted NodU family carbamoyl transferase
VEDGRIVAAAQEERFTRIKHDPSFPTHAIESCLSQAGVRLRDIVTSRFTKNRCRNSSGCSRPT